MTDTLPFRDVLVSVADGEVLDREQAKRAFLLLMEGAATPPQTAAFLMALRVRGEQIQEITGAAEAMRSKCTPVHAPDDAIDTCGTGGDRLGTVNVSTAAALVAAGCGATVAKHGNRSVSSRSGSSDVLAALGVKISVPAATVEQAIQQAGIGFLMAPVYHPAMRNVAPVRVDLGLRTIFNLLGPLANPAGVRRQVVGVFSRRWLEPLARVLHELGSEHAWLVHGADGMDELTLTDVSHVTELRHGEIRSFSVTPEDAGLARCAPEQLRGGDAPANAESLRRLLEGDRGPYRDIVLLNAAAALIVARRASSLAEGVAVAAQSIDTGAAAAVLEKLVACMRCTP